MNQIKTHFDHLEDPHLKSILHLMHFGQRLEKYSNTLLKLVGISYQQYNLLRIVENTPQEYFSLKELQNKLINQTSNASRLVEKLRLKGYLKTSPNKENRSKLDISITKKGIQFLKETTCPIQLFVNKMKMDMSETEAKAFTNLICKAQQSL